MERIHEELLDAPPPSPQRFPLWAFVGALGIVGFFAGIFGTVMYSGAWDATISLEDTFDVPPMVEKLVRNSKIVLAFGVVLTVLRKEPKSTFRSWVIGIGLAILSVIILLVGFALSLEVFYNR